MEKLIKKKMRRATTIAISLIMGIFAAVGLSVYFFIIKNITVACVLLLAAALVSYFCLLFHFAHITLYFPFNSFYDYKMKLSYKEDLYQKYGVLNGDTLTIYVEEKDGIWTTKFAEKTLIFDLRHYWFPKAYIRAYLGRQLQFLQINKKNLRRLSLVDGLDLTITLISDNIQVEFYWKNKTKIKNIVKNRKTCFTPLGKVINASTNIDYYFAPK